MPRYSFNVCVANLRIRMNNLIEPVMQDTANFPYLDLSGFENLTGLENKFNEQK